MSSKDAVHQNHCCIHHGCKYNESECPVVKKNVTQTVGCIDCRELFIVGHLEVTSFVWCGSLGAQHYYGELRYKLGTSKYWSDNYHSKEVYRILGKKDALILNKIDGSSGRFGAHRPGDQCTRFDTVDDVIRRGVEMWTEWFPKGILFKGRSSTASAKPVIYWPKRLDKMAKKINTLAEEWEHIDGYEGDEKRAEEIDNSFIKICKHIGVYKKS